MIRLKIFLYLALRNYSEISDNYVPNSWTFSVTVKSKPAVDLKVNPENDTQTRIEVLLDHNQMSVAQLSRKLSRNI